MKYTEIVLKSSSISSLKNELFFEIASSRVSGIELICFILNNEEKKDSGAEKLFLSLERHLKKIKERGIIQFYATKASFDNNTTEAKFLNNKYPEHFKSTEFSDSHRVFYIKL